MLHFELSRQASNLFFDALLSTLSSHFQHVFGVTSYTSSSYFPLLFDVTLWMFLIRGWWQNCWSSWNGMMVECLPSKKQLVWGHLKHTNMSAFTNGIKVWRHFNHSHGHVQRQKKTSCIPHSVIAQKQEQITSSCCIWITGGCEPWT